MKKTLEDQINECASYLFDERVVSFIEDIIPLFELYNIEDDSDWVEEKVGKENQANIRAIRTVYLISKIADTHAGMLSNLKVNYPRLWLRMRKLCGMGDM